MRTLIIATSLCGIAAVACAQTADKPRTLPPDINPQSFSRLPLIQRDQMDENGKHAYDVIAGKDRTTPFIGPAAVSLYSPGVAMPIRELNEYLRTKGVLGPRLTELAILVAAREVDQQYEWSGHEPAARRVGVEQSIIDIVKYNKDVVLPGGKPLGEKEALIIRFGRQLFREKKLSSPLYADAERLFGKQGTVELATLMGDYAMAGILLHAVDQHLPPDRKELLPLN